ncbi:hypothetical protein [Sphingobium lactosutens]|uniref:Uncharacterized protein n=1 Tax=Sphingobium lactosutens DS20 TaxID=1331060 RepID=T0IPV0_9SPHN|nr:hypothetical protein [Sphingobium lactosutens]EQB11684.1 hypothetical protein RLDS_21370 [Sphingobium lactosutens DS20]
MVKYELSPLNLVQELFVFMTALCEGATEIGMQGQAEDDAGQIHALANSLRETGLRLILISEAITMITPRDES